MKITLLNGSPKAKESTSAYLLKEVYKMLEDKQDVTEVESRLVSPFELANAIAQSDALLVVFPLYVDGIPGHLLALLEEMQQTLQSNPNSCRVYAVVQSGFYEARQNHLAMEMMQIWCEKAGLAWGQGICLGAGGMAQFAPLGHGPGKNMGDAATLLLNNLEQMKQGETLFCHPNFPRFLYKLAAHSGWRKAAKENGLKAKDLYRKV